MNKNISGSLFVLCSLSGFSAQADFGNVTGQITNQVIRQVSGGIAKNLSDNLIIPKLRIRNGSGQVQQLSVSADRRFLTLAFADKTVRVWDLSVGVQRPMIVLPGVADNFNLNSVQQTIAVRSGHQLTVFDVLTGRQLRKIDLPADTAMAEISADHKHILSLQQKQLRYRALNTSKAQWQLEETEGAIIRLALAPASPHCLTIVRQEGIFGDNYNAELRSLEDGHLIQSLSLDDKPVTAHFTNDGFVALALKNGQYLLWDIKQQHQQIIADIDLDIVDFSQAGQLYAYVLSNGEVLIADQQNREQFRLKKEKLQFQKAVFLDQGQWLATVTNEGSVFIWDMRSGEEKLRLVTTQQGWTVLDYAGRFDSSEQGMNNVSWEADKEDIPLDNFSGKYYEPGLLTSTLTADTLINQEAVVVQDGITLPPKLEIVVREVKPKGDSAELTVDVYDQGGGIDQINLYHNTKALPMKQAVADERRFQEQERERVTLSVLVKPTPGKNRVRVIANNKMGIEGKSAETTFSVAMPAAEPSQTSEAFGKTLRVATVGINEYQDARLNLDYSVADAESIAVFLSQKERITYPKTEQRRIYNNNATKLSIMDALREISRGAEEDVLAIYFAGHGIAVKGEWYFLPYETTLQPQLDYFAQVGISATELSEVFRDSKVQRILFMVDSCFSGSSVDSFRRLQNSQRHFSRAMSRSVGITVLTATRKDQEAAELSDLGHGLFTYVLNTGMEGKADWKPVDNEITAHELAEFSVKEIPAFSKKYIEAAQEPTSFTMGQDFPLLYKR